MVLIYLLVRYRPLLFNLFKLSSFKVVGDGTVVPTREMNLLTTYFELLAYSYCLLEKTIM